MTDLAGEWDEGAAILMALAEATPIAHDAELAHGGIGERCVLCDAEAPAGATTLAASQHYPDCPWLRAREWCAPLWQARHL